MHKLTFYPLGNADCCRIDLERGKKILFDYADMRDPDDPDDARCDLPKELREDLEDAKSDFYDVVAFTHLDEDHYKGATDFFWFEHAKKYQSSKRIKINTMWVPAAVITEENLEKEEARIIQREAQYRFKDGKGIRVFSRPERLQKWCEKNDINFDDRKHLVTDAGQLTPEFNLLQDGVEFFVHSPFAKRLDDGNIEDRNDDALVMQATFVIDGVETKALLMADVIHDILTEIVDVTRAKKRSHRLEWDVAKIPHHCSYLSLAPEKGVDKTQPAKNVKWLYEEQGQDASTIVSTSKPIPVKGSTEDKDDQPPHRQAANYYKSVAHTLEGEFIVTMEHPKDKEPKPLIIQIDGSKATVRKRAVSAAALVTSGRTPRAG